MFKVHQKLLCLISLVFLFINIACNQESPRIKIGKIELINPEGQKISTRFQVPSGFARTPTKKHTFGDYLRTLPVKPHNSYVRYFNGGIKPNRNIYEAVVDLNIGSKDLHQCADAVIRLRAEHLFQNKLYDKIHFNFTNGFNVAYSKWMKGYRIVVNGNKSHWIKMAEPSNSYASFWKYLEIIFSYAGTLSLAQELNPVSVEEIQIGDVFIQGGSPGHAIIVIDMAINKKTSEKIFLLAQSYMPAQELQVLANNHNHNLGPWYSQNFEELLRTPEWLFSRSDLKRFK